MELCYYILNCTFRVHTVICTECVERESSTCTRKCRSTNERNIKDTSDCLSLDVWYRLCTDTCYMY